MADFLQAVNITLVREGGYVDNPADPGGATNFGITQADMPGQDMRKVTVPMAIEHYREHYWKPLYNSITNQPICNKLFDAGVLLGIGTAVKILQKALLIDVDGTFGDGTLLALNACLTPPALLQAFKNELVIHVVGIGAAKPAERIFVNGWINRINS